LNKAWILEQQNQKSLTIENPHYRKY